MLPSYNLIYLCCFFPLNEAEIVSNEAGDGAAGKEGRLFQLLHTNEREGAMKATKKKKSINLNFLLIPRRNHAQ
jgi:hypothetical protein